MIYVYVFMCFVNVYIGCCMNLIKQIFEDFIIEKKKREKKTYFNRNLVTNKIFVDKKNNYNKYLKFSILVQEYIVYNRITFICCY